jgi:hypothetical protein
MASSELPKRLSFKNELRRLEVEQPAPIVKKETGFFSFFKTSPNTSPKSAYTPVSVVETEYPIKRSTSLGDEESKYHSPLSKQSKNALNSQSLGALSYSLLSIPERILVLALTDQGSIRSGLSDIEHVLLYGILAELIIRQRVTTYNLLQNPNAKKSVQRYGLDVINTSTTGIGLFDEILQKINFRYQVKKNVRIESVMESVLEDVSKTLLKRFMLMLCERGILKRNTLELLIVNYDSYTLLNPHVRGLLCKDIVDVLTKIEDRYHQTTASPHTPIRGLSPQNFAFIGLLYNHEEMLFVDVLQKHFVGNESGVSQLKHTAGEMIHSYQVYQTSWNENEYSYLFRMLEEFHK